MEKFDAIVVGAGPAGCSCAYVMVKAGLKVLVFERGKYAGSKNMWGGAFFGPQINDLFPNFWEDAPVERFVTSHVIYFLSEKGSFSINYKSARFGLPPYNGFILLRAKFDQWFTKKAEKAGAIVATGLKVDDLIIEDGKVRGVRVGKELFSSDVVIVAEGANAILTGKAGLSKEIYPRDMKQGVKEIIQLPQGVIEERFNLKGDEGVAMEFVGLPTQHLPGGGFLYTNKDTISIGVVAQLSAIAEKRIGTPVLLEEFKRHPDIEVLIKGGQTVEYSAHLIPVSGIRMMPRLYGNGLLISGDAAGLLLGTGLILEGANFAVASGMAAGEIVKMAKEKGDYSSKTLSCYEGLLRNGFVMKDLFTFREASHFLENERIYRLYPELACEIAEKIFANNGQPRKRTFQMIKETVREKVSLCQIFQDFMKARKAI